MISHDTCIAEGNKQTRKVALVVGAQGVIGRNLVDYLTTLDDWNIIGVARRGGVTLSF